MQIAKYSASGNDFVLFHAQTQENRSSLAKELCHRQNGIGADGLIVLLPHDTLDFEWQFYNSDGSTAAMCGNGSRACAHYALSEGLASSTMDFLTEAGVIHAVVDGTMVQSELTPPVIVEKDISINTKSWWKIDTGVPHMVHITQSVEEFDLIEAREIRNTYNANVNIACIDGKNLRVRTYERGVEDETLACGTGIAASYYRALQEGLVEGSIEVYAKSGETLYLGMNEKTITFKGKVKNTFVTEWEI